MADLRGFHAVACALAASALALSACAARLPYAVSPPRANPAPQAFALSGKFLTSDAQTVDLANLSDKPVVLIFSQDTCSVCGHEADSLRASLAHPDRAPSRVHLETILVGAIADDAIDWKAGHGIPWDVGIDPDSILFKQYCQVLSVPCVVVAVPGQGIVLRRNGPVGMGEMTALTGPWEEP